MGTRIKLALALHNHQPVGNFGWVFEEATEVAYLPMLECLERHPRIRLALHYTGPLRDWLAENRPDFLPRVRKLVQRGQVEIMTGAYYEAVLVALDDADKLGQINKLTEAVKSDFGFEAKGLWLAERIWEPHLPKTLADAGVSYTIVDDAHFKAVGYQDEDLLGHYVTEEQGCAVKVFATSMPLRYSIPWKPVEDTIAWLREQADAEPLSGRYEGKVKVAVMGDDGEKFGMWPGTHKHIWLDGWMEDFFEAIEESSDWLETVPPGDAARDLPSLGRVYLPAASYDEMGEWAMPADQSRELHRLKRQFQESGQDQVARHMRGGMWRNFMVKYPEVNQLHKKAQFVSRKVRAMPDGDARRQALDHLWAGQCNCAYWHGVFGGIYLFHIREADYRHLIAAENLADDLDDSAKPFARVEVADFDTDGLDDAIITTDRHSLIVDPNQGGSLTEWDLRKASYNILNVMTRCREGYHRDLLEAAAAGAVVSPDSPKANGDAPNNIHTDVVRAKEGGLHEKLFDDWHRRASLLDHFLGSGATLDGVYRANYEELGDFVTQPYTVITGDKTAAAPRITLRRNGRVWQGAAHRAALVEKTLQLAPGADDLSVKYTIANENDVVLEARFGVEMNWGLAGGNDSHSRLLIEESEFSLAEIAENADVNAMTIISDLWGIEIGVRIEEHAATVWRFPLETVSASEGGFERNYQGTSILMWWPLRLAPGRTWRISLIFTAKSTT